MEEKENRYRRIADPGCLHFPNVCLALKLFFFFFCKWWKVACSDFGLIIFHADSLLANCKILTLEPEAEYDLASLFPSFFSSSIVTTSTACVGSPFVFSYHSASAVTDLLITDLIPYHRLHLYPIALHSLAWYITLSFVSLCEVYSILECKRKSVCLSSEFIPVLFCLCSDSLSLCAQLLSLTTWVYRTCVQPSVNFVTHTYWEI